MYSNPIQVLIRRRYSCRSYDASRNTHETFQKLGDFISNLDTGPFNAPTRFLLVTADGEQKGNLRGLGTYGTIKDPAGFVIGVSSKSAMYMEDFGYRMELIVLKAAELELGTCWLGGSFTRWSFARKAAIKKGETLPAVCSIGYPAEAMSMEKVERARKRFSREALFFDNDFGKPLDFDQAGKYADPLEMVRLAPSAKNYQPWRIVRQGRRWHFFMQRIKGYREFVVPVLTGIADLQRMDMGIAMSHFELAARAAGLDGSWEISEPGIPVSNTLMEYCVTWSGSQN